LWYKNFGLNINIYKENAGRESALEEQRKENNDMKKTVIAAALGLETTEHNLFAY